MLSTENEIDLFIRWRETEIDLATLRAEIIRLQELDVKHPALDQVRKACVRVHYRRISLNQAINRANP